MITKYTDKDITRLNTFRMRVRCRFLLEYDSVADLVDIDFDALPKPILQMGAGSNMLFSRDFPGTIMHSAIDFIYELPVDDPLYRTEDKDAVIVSVGAGVAFDRLCAWAASNGLWGIENLSHIPGDTGSAVVQNIGAYGVEVSDVIRQVYCYDIEEEEFVHFTNEECAYGYRDSMFKHEPAKSRYIVTNVVISLTRCSSPKLDYGHVREAIADKFGSDIDEASLTPGQIRDVVTQIRIEKLPEVTEIGSAGSFFKNPIVSDKEFDRVCEVAASESFGEVPHYKMGDSVKIPAAWLIEKCGWKGRVIGNAGVYAKQPLVLVNATGKATPDEVIRLKDKIIYSVRDKFGITLQPEVEII